MDMAFLRRAERMLVADSPRLDHGLLLATLVAAQAERPARSDAEAPIEEPLVELLLGRADCQRALAAQRGCFNRAEAGRRLNAT